MRGHRQLSVNIPAGIASGQQIRVAGLMPNATIRAEPVTTDEIRAVGSTLIVAHDPARAERKSRKQR